MKRRKRKAPGANGRSRTALSAGSDSTLCNKAQLQPSEELLDVFRQRITRMVGKPVARPDAETVRSFMRRLTSPKGGRP